MKMNYTFRHLDHSDAIVEHTHRNLEEIGRFLLKGGQGQVHYSKMVRGEFNGDYCVEISINTREKFFKAKAVGTDIYACVNDVVDKLERQFLKVRKIHQRHKKYDLSKEGRLREMNGQFEKIKSSRKAA